jgi:hypothetical protein
MSEKNIHYQKRIPRLQSNLNNNTNNHNTNRELYPTYNTKQQHYRYIPHVRKRSNGLMCSVCDGPAHGYNFDTITCESCKAFFRRNALKPNVCVHDNLPYMK